METTEVLSQQNIPTELKIKHSDTSVKDLPYVIRRDDGRGIGDITLEHLIEVFDTDNRHMAIASLDLLIRASWLEVGCSSFQWLAESAAIVDRENCNMDGVAEDEPVDVDSLVSQWTETIVGLSTHHSHEGWTTADHSTDDLMGPLLTAPVVQIREFTSKLATALKSDQRVPFLIWSSFQEIVEPLILKSKDGEVITLKKELASQVAELVERNLDRSQLVAALAGSLQWRGTTQLKAVKTNLEAGAKPTIRGRESCLFLDVPAEDGKITTVVI